MFKAMTQEERDHFEAEMTGGNFSIGEYYVGERNEAGQRHGTGTLYWPNGSIYEGSFAFGRQNGRGKHSMFNGDVYEGEFKNNRMNGSGIYRWADSGEYRGEWLNDRMHGQGLRTWPNGAYHEGEYQVGARNGRGKMVHSNGEVFEGVFVNDHRKEGELTYANGDKYTGEFKDELPHGRGMIVYSSGQTTFTGRFRNGKPDINTHKEINLSDLTIGQVHTGMAISGVIVSEPFKLNALQITLRDSKGDEISVSVYNYPGYQGSFFTSTNVDAMLKPDMCGLTQNRRIRIRDPYCKIAMDGRVAIRVEDFSTIDFE